MRKLFRSASLAVLAFGAGACAAQGLDRQARSWAASCTTCHAADSRNAGVIPAIAGRDADLLWRTLLEFKNGQRPAATIMHQHTKGYSDEELKRIALYFASVAAK